MREQEQEAVLVALMEALAARDSWCGETHIQKAVYFLQEAKEVPLGFEFVFYKHGPFSFDLRERLGEMRGSRLIEVRPRAAPYGPSLDVGPSAPALKRRLPKTSVRYKRQIEFVSDLIEGKDVLQLERLSTALYVTRLEPGATPETRAGLIVDLKPHIDELEARKAVASVDKLLT